MYHTLNPMPTFKSENRQKPPVWSNRFRKDFNDLMYSPKDLRDIEYIKKSPKDKGNANSRKKLAGKNPMQNAMEKYNLVPYDSRVQSSAKMQRSNSTKSTGEIFTSKSSELIRTPKSLLENPESFKLKQKIYQNSKISPLLRTTMTLLKRSQSASKINSANQDNNFGLSKFEFTTKTIEGKIHSKPGHHLDLSKLRTQKITNLNPIYYNKDEDIMMHEHEKRKIIETLMKYRNFKSYSPHKLYTSIGGAGDGGLLDRFYDTKKDQLDLVKKKCALEPDFVKLTPRPGIPKKLGTNLDYPKAYTELAKANTARPLYDVQKAERNLVISKQVIYDKRGCYR